MINLHQKLFSFFVIIASFFCFISPAQATLMDGKTVRLAHSSGFGFNSTTATVDGNVEWATGYEGYYSVDVSDSEFTISFNNHAGWNVCCGFNGFILTDIDDTIAAFTVAALKSSSFDFPSSAVSFDANSIYVNFAAYGQTPYPGTITVSIDGNSVPEPASLSLLLLSLAGLLVSRNRAKNFGKLKAV